jgi:hypothetical protein
VHPDALDPQINALLDNLLADLGVGQDENRIRSIRDRFQIGLTRIALEGGQARVDRVNGVSLLLELAVAQVAACLALVRNTHHGNPFLSEKVLDEDVDLGHKLSF